MYYVKKKLGCNTVDPNVTEYLKRIQEFSIPSRAEVVEIANQLADSRSNFQKTILRSKDVLKDCLNLLTKVLHNRVRYDSAFNVCNRDQEKIRQIRMSLADVIAELEDAIEQKIPNSSDDVTNNGQLPIPLSRLPHLRGMIERIPIRTHHFDAWFSKLEKTILKVSARRSRHDSKISRFQRRVFQQAKHHRDLYHHSKQALALTGLKLVVAIAKRYANRGLSLMELIQEGNSGLMTAAEQYDPKRGCAFSTYATNWIRQAINIAVFEKSRIVRLPMALTKKLLNAQRELRQLSHNESCSPTVEDKSLVISKNRDVNNWFCNYKNGFVSIDKLSNQDDSRLMELVDTSVEPLTTILHRRHVAAEIRRAVGMLDDKKRKIVELRFGLDGNVCTLTSIGEQMGISRSRVAQLEAESLGLLKLALHRLDDSQL